MAVKKEIRDANTNKRYEKLNDLSNGKFGELKKEFDKIKKTVVELNVRKIELRKELSKWLSIKFS